EQPQADVIKVQGPAEQLRPLLLQVLRVLNDEVGQHQGQGTDRDIDVEDPAPVVLDHEVAAQGRADDGRQQGRDAEHRLGDALLLGRKRIEQHGLAGGLQAAPGQALDHPEQDNLPQAGGHAAQPRSEGEDGDGQQEVVAAAQAGRDPAGDRQDGGGGGQVAGQDPLLVDDRRRQAAGDGAQRDVRDGGVEHLHDGGDDHGDGDNPGVDRPAANYGGSECHAAHDAYSAADNRSPDKQSSSHFDHASPATERLLVHGPLARVPGFGA